MFIFNPKRIMKMRGIDKMFNFLHKNGFIRNTANYIVNETVSSIKIEHIGRLCLILNCTPNDLFEWQKDEQNVLPENHALNALVKESLPEVNIKKLLRDIPLDKLQEAEALLKGLKDG